MRGTVFSRLRAGISTFCRDTRGNTMMLTAGALAGLGVGWLAAEAVARLIGARTGLSLAVTLGAGEIRLAALMALTGSLVAVLPAIAAWRRPVGDALRS